MGDCHAKGEIHEGPANLYSVHPTRWNELEVVPQSRPLPAKGSGRRTGRAPGTPLCSMLCDLHARQLAAGPCESGQ